MANLNDYLPLKIARMIDGFEISRFKQKGISLDDMGILALGESSGELSPAMKELQRWMLRGADSSRPQEQVLHNSRILLYYSIIEKWAQNKQVYAFDSDFLDEMLSMEELTISEKVFDFLPYRSFYLDFAESAKMRELFDAEGFFVEVHDYDRVVRINLVSVKLQGNGRPYIDYIPFTCPNDKEIVLTKENFTQHFGQYDLLGRDDDEMKPFDSPNLTKSFTILQLILYLASVEPDVKENPKTHISYQKPKNKVRNVYSEVQKWDVGIRFGNAFRKWKTAKENNNTSVSVRNGSKKRPHTRRAHWSHFWYGHGEDKIRRPKWVSEVMVGIGDPITTIHKVKGE